MITGFERETFELTDYELTLVPLMVNGLKTKKGKVNSITNKKMVIKMKALNHKINDVRVRKLIHHIRVNKLVPNLISSSKGYWIAENQEEVEKYLKSLKERCNSINEIIKSFN